MMGMMNLADIAAAEREEVRRGGGWIILLGVLIAALGVAALVFVGATTIFTILFVGWVFLISGVAEAVHAVVRRGWSGFWLDLLAGVLSALVGLFIILHPAQGAGVLTAVIGVMFLVGGVLRIVVGFGVRSPLRGWLVFHGIVSALLGGMILAEWPESAIWVIGTLVAIDLIFEGVRLITFGLAARRLTAAADDRPGSASAPTG